MSFSTVLDLCLIYFHTKFRSIRLSFRRSRDFLQWGRDQSWKTGLRGDAVGEGLESFCGRCSGLWECPSMVLTALIDGVTLGDSIGVNGVVVAGSHAKRNRGNNQ